MTRLLLAYNAAEADVVRIAGSPNALGVRYHDTQLRVNLVAKSATDWMDPIATTGDTLFETTYIFGKPNPLRLRSVNWVADGETIANVVLGFTLADGTADGLDVTSTLGNDSLYLERGNHLYEWTSEGLTVTGGTATYGFAGDDELGTAYVARFNDVVEGDEFGLVIAQAGAFIPEAAGGVLDVMKHATIELLKLRLTFDGLKSIRDGTYNQDQVNHEMERQRILNMVYEAVL